MLNRYKVEVRKSCKIWYTSTIEINSHTKTEALIRLKELNDSQIEDMVEKWELEDDLMDTFKIKIDYPTLTKL